MEDGGAKLVADCSSAVHKRMKVFLYNAYAKVLWEWMQPSKKGKGGSNSNDFILQLRNVPAICIVPYAMDPHNWLD
jgi:hypothetical protein